MTCTNCKKLEWENNKLREKVEIMERVRDIHITQIEENSDRYEAILDQAKERIQNCLAGRRSSMPTLYAVYPHGAGAGIRKLLRGA